MTVEERLKDISDRSGLSVESCRRFRAAEIASLKESLLKGERATVPGICTITADRRSRLKVGGEVSHYIKLTMKPAGSLESSLDNISIDTEKEEFQFKNPDIVAVQISSLA